MIDSSDRAQLVFSSSSTTTAPNIATVARKGPLFCLWYTSLWERNQVQLVPFRVQRVQSKTISLQGMINVREFTLKLKWSLKKINATDQRSVTESAALSAKLVRAAKEWHKTGIYWGMLIESAFFYSVLLKRQTKNSRP